jgi:arylsulfatase A-like enzyme
MQEMEIATDLSWGSDLKLRWYPGVNENLTYGHKLLSRRLTTEQLAAWNNAYGPKNATFHQQFKNGLLQSRDLTLWKYQRYVKDYLRTVRSMDDQVGRLLDALDQDGLTDETIVIYTSDQGFFLGEKGWFDKRWMYDESLQMPLLVRWPGVVIPGSENTALVQNLDLAQTILEAVGVEPPNAMQGRSLVPLLRGEAPSSWRDAIYYHYYAYPAIHSVMRHEGVRTNRYKLIHYYPLNQWELFDLETDPRELNNLYGHPDYAQVTARLKERLDQLKDTYEVPPATSNVSLQDLRR